VTVDHLRVKNNKPCQTVILQCELRVWPIFLSDLVGQILTCQVTKDFDLECAMLNTLTTRVWATKSDWEATVARR